MGKIKPRWDYIYGLNPAFEVVRGGRRTVHGAWLNEGSANHPRLKKLARFLESREVPIEWVDKRRVFDLAQSKEHQGVALKVSPYPYTPFEDVLGQPRLLLLDNVEDPHNTGAIIRSADCFGFNGVLLPLRGTPEIYPSVVKVSAGATEHLNIVREASSNHYFNRAMEAGYTAVALDAKGQDKLSELDLEGRPLLLVIGGEAKSVGQYILNKTQYTARIDQFGKINSLNASVAAGIAMCLLR